MRDISIHAHKAWDDTVYMLKTERHCIWNIRAIDRPSTYQVLKAYKPKDRVNLLRHIAQFFQTGRQKAKWCSDDASRCEFCNDEDSKEHRLLHCEAFADIRANHPHAIDALENFCPGWIDLPIILAQPDSEYLFRMHNIMPAVDIPGSAIRLLSELGQSDPVNVASTHSVSQVVMLPIPSSLTLRNQMPNAGQKVPVTLPPS